LAAQYGRALQRMHKFARKAYEVPASLVDRVQIGNASDARAVVDSD
jgi:hypothetical protein